MAEKIFETNHVLMRQRKAQGEIPVRTEISARMRERLGEVKGDMEKVVWIGEEILADDFTLEGGPYDAVVVDGFLPVVNDVPLTLVRCLQAMRGDGLLLGWVMGAESFRELREAWREVDGKESHVVPLTDVREVGALLQRMQVVLPVVDRDVVTVTFKDFEGLYAALRAHGVGNFHQERCKGLTTPGRLRRMEEAYRTLFKREDGRVPLTLEVIYLHGFKRGEGQPTAARRGSGKVSLVRILGEGEG